MYIYAHMPACMYIYICVCVFVVYASAYVHLHMYVLLYACGCCDGIFRTLIYAILCIGSCVNVTQKVKVGNYN